MSERTFTSLELAYMQLQRQGKPRDEAAAVLLADPSLADTLAPAMEREMREEAAARARAEYEASPAGRQEAAARAAQAKADREQLVSNSRALLESEGYAGVGSWHEDDVLVAAGVVERPVSMMSAQEREKAELDLVTAWPTLDPDARRERARELGLDQRTIESARDVLGLGEEGQS